MRRTLLPLNQLIDLAKEKTEAATRRLCILNSAQINAQKQLNSLYEYRQEYLQRLQDAMQTGITATDCHNFQSFIATLDNAIQQQNIVLNEANSHLERGREHWQQEKRKLKSFNALAQRDLQAKAIIDSRKEQRLNDEYSTIRLAHRRQAGTH